MTVTLTANYFLKKTAVGTDIDAWGPNPNDNFDTIDARMKINADAAAAATAGLAGKAPLAHFHNFTDINAGAVTNAQLGAGVVSNVKMEAMPALTFKGNSSGSAATPGDITVANAKTMLGITGTVSPHTHPISEVTGLQTALDSIRTTEALRAYSGSLTIADAGCMVTFAGAASVAVPTSIFAAGHRIDFINLSSGEVSFVGGVLRSYPSGANKLTGLYAGATIYFLTGSEYVLVGNIKV